MVKLARFGSYCLRFHGLSFGSHTRDGLVCQGMHVDTCDSSVEYGLYALRLSHALMQTGLGLVGLSFFSYFADLTDMRLHDSYLDHS